MQVEQRKIADIHPYERNPRKNDAAVEAVANSIRQFGFRQPIVVDAESEPNKMSEPGAPEDDQSGQVDTSGG